MEETREKIELFRNYYLVCFRSFDQDPYSQTHLEPLNMYIIVFREGTLSVSPLALFSLELFQISTRRADLSRLSFAASVPLSRHSSPSKCPSSNQAAQGLHRRHLGLDLVRSHR